MSLIKSEVKKLEEEMDQLQRTALESNHTYEAFLILQGKYRALKSVYNRLSEAMRKRDVPDPGELDPDEEPAPRRRLPLKARGW